MPDQMQTGERGGFMQFYRGAYRDDHSAWPNRALHIAGTVGGLALLAASFILVPLRWALAFPVVHVVPGLIGHRLFDRNAELGDLRIFQRKYPAHWFMVANHMMTAQTAWNIATLKSFRHGR
jgi:hypothetical protein